MSITQRRVSRLEGSRDQKQKQNAERERERKKNAEGAGKSAERKMLKQQSVKTMIERSS